MLTIGLTGGIACGKSIVSHYFEQLGIPVIDTDIIARQLVEPNQTALAEIIDCFGNDIVDHNHQLNRKRLRDIIFTSSKNRQQLEAILHPKIQAIVLEKLAALEQKNTTESTNIPYCIIVIPLFFETRSNYPIDRILVIDCTEHQQIERCMSRDNISKEQCKNIINNQTSRTERLERSDDVIKNETTPDSCYSQIRDNHEKYLNLSKINI